MSDACPEYQRQWRNLCVDRGLKDVWLEKLNAMTRWKPYSSCEGHVRTTHAGAEDHPRVWFETDRAPTQRLAEAWRDRIGEFQVMRERHFPDIDTASALHFNHNSRLFGTNFTLHLDSKFKRHSEEPGREILVWWENTIRRMQRFDREFAIAAFSDI